MEVPMYLLYIGITVAVFIYQNNLIFIFFNTISIRTEEGTCTLFSGAYIVDSSKASFDFLLLGKTD